MKYAGLLDADGQEADLEASEIEAEEVVKAWRTCY